MAKAVSSMRSLTSHYKPQVSDKVIEAETRWATFVAKHNLAFLSSDHATIDKRGGRGIGNGTYRRVSLFSYTGVPLVNLLYITTQLTNLLYITTQLHS